MYPRIKAVKAQDDYKILLTFVNDEVKLFDMKPYLNKGFFKQLQDRSYFNTVKPFMDSIKWKNGQDLCPDTLYLDSQTA
jgi:predicted N-acyltransferase